jgi:endogenous inhibitor of DNA gyrase (YacG/DUF329 family)
MNFTTNTTMTHVPMCHTCGQAEVAGPFTTADGEGFCSAACQAEAQAEFAAWSAEQDAEYDESMDGDFDSGMASAGFGTDEDY